MKYVLLGLLSFCSLRGVSQHNPIIPDLIADPSILKIGNTYYCYATTDGWGRGLATSGPPVVWTSTDFVNWQFKGTCFPAALGNKYWAPSKVVPLNGKYYFYPTLNENIHVAIADKPEGPFKLLNGADTLLGPTAPRPLMLFKAPQGTKGIDAEAFIDNDGQAYLFWAQRGAVKLNPDMVSLDTTAIVRLQTKRGGYSEGPIFFKRKGVYYYLYTLEGHENYKYAYGHNKTSPLGPYTFPEQDIIAATDTAKKIYGPGHGSVFNEPGTDRWYFAYLEFGRGGTTRQVWVNKLTFNSDGTIQPVVLTHEGVLPAGKAGTKNSNLAAAVKATVTASSVMPDLTVKPVKEPRLQRTETYQPSNATDGSNGTRWMANAADSVSAWYTVDLGTVKQVKRAALYFVTPVAGHAYKLEYSVDNKHWTICGGHVDIRIQSPHTDDMNIKARYVRVTILSGIPGIWEFTIN